MTGYFSKSLCASAFLSIAVAVLVVGCNHPRSTTKSTTAASYQVSQLSQALVGKRITVRGKFFVGKEGDGIQLENEAVYLIEMNPKPVFEAPYSEMYGKLVEATGTLGFYHDPSPIPDKTEWAEQRAGDYYYFYYETTQVRLVGR